MPLFEKRLEGSETRPKSYPLWRGTRAASRLQPLCHKRRDPCHRSFAAYVNQGFFGGCCCSSVKSQTHSPAWANSPALDRGASQILATPPRPRKAPRLGRLTSSLPEPLLRETCAPQVAVVKVKSLPTHGETLWETVWSFGLPSTTVAVVCWKHPLQSRLFSQRLSFLPSELLPQCGVRSWCLLAPFVRLQRCNWPRWL